MLSRDGHGLPPWRRQVMPWLMAVLRLAIIWAIFRGPIQFVWAPPSVLHLPEHLRLTFLILLIVGSPLFLWPRSCWMGGMSLAAAVMVYETLWRGSGLPAVGTPLLAVGLIVVLVLGEVVAGVARRRVYSDR